MEGSGEAMITLLPPYPQKEKLMSKKEKNICEGKRYVQCTAWVHQNPLGKSYRLANNEEEN